jgi:short-subunit dehydrogenase
VAVVTGATSGIGREIASLLAARGYQMLLVGRDLGRLRDSAEGLVELHSGRAELFACDLTDEASRHRLIDRLAEPSVAILCNVAGAGSFGPTERLDANRLRNHVELNVVAVHDLCQAVVPGMIDQGDGAILLAGSTAGNQPVPGAATYAATKAFVNSYAQALQAELAPAGIACTLLTPGPVRTDFARRAGRQDLADRLPAAVWIDAHQAATAAVNGLAQGRRRVTPGCSGTLIAAGGRLIPNRILLPLLQRLIERATRRSGRPR